MQLTFHFTRDLIKPQLPLRHKCKAMSGCSHHQTQVKAEHVSEHERVAQFCSDGSEAAIAKEQVSKVVGLK
jgi:hypothetical protein